MVANNYFGPYDSKDPLNQQRERRLKLAKTPPHRKGKVVLIEENPEYGIFTVCIQYGNRFEKRARLFDGEYTPEYIEENGMKQIAFRSATLDEKLPEGMDLEQLRPFLASDPKKIGYYPQILLDEKNEGKNTKYFLRYFLRAKPSHN